MRKLVVLTFVSLDGVMQSPGGKEEDPSNGFALGGWLVPYFDEEVGNAMGKQMGEPFDLLLGRKTYEMMGNYWRKQTGPGAKELNSAKKYLVSHEEVIDPWEETIQIKGDIVAEIKKLKEGEGPMLQVHGSNQLIQTLLENDLADELWLKIFPVTLGQGKRLFGEGTRPAAFKLFESSVSESGVIIASYKRNGDLQFGSVT